MLPCVVWIEQRLLRLDCESHRCKGIPWWAQQVTEIVAKKTRRVWSILHLLPFDRITQLSAWRCHIDYDAWSAWSTNLSAKSRCCCIQRLGEYGHRVQLTVPRKTKVSWKGKTDSFWKPRRSSRVVDNSKAGLYIAAEVYIGISWIWILRSPYCQSSA